MQQQSVRSRVNQPERLSLRSDDDTTNQSSPTFSAFQNNLPTAILDAKRCQMIRATIPNAQVSIPNYQLVFWYYHTATDTLPTAADLYAVRLFPSWYIDVGTLGYTPSINQIFNSPTDFVNALNQAAAEDDGTDNPFWAGNDITFAYDATTNKITFEGTAAGEYYSNAGWNDPNVISAIQGTATKGVIKMDILGSKFPQPLAVGYTLNLRCGYAMSGTCQAKFSVSGKSNIYANVGNTNFVAGTPILVDSYPNLVYTNCIYIYASFITNSSLTSSNEHNLLAVVPVESVPLGITNYICATSNLLTKLSQTIQTVIIEMRDDANQPYELPDNAQVSLEVSFSYQDKGF